MLQRGISRFESSNPEPSSPDAHRVAGSAFDHAVGRALGGAQPDASVGMLLVSIDYFDVVTASHGANIAHELLSITADRIGEVVRLNDEMAQHDDGFFILWAPGPGAPAITEIASRITTRFNQPVMTSVGQLPITVSVGITSVSGRQCAETTVRMLKRQARSAVLSAQRTGRAQLAIFDQATQKQAIESYETERHLHAALRDERLGVDYQPIVSLHSGQTVAVEALARWNDDVLGSISPTTFIPIAEEAGLIGELGRHIMQTAIAQGSAWNQVGQPAPITTFNLSNRQLLDPELIPTIDLLLTEHHLDPSQLCLEISESVVMSDVAASMTILGHMKDLGLRLAIDNFGTGYSSLSYLRRLPVDILKIDQSFVQSVYNRDDRVITKAIIDLAHTLGMTTIAEGVETRLQVEVLHALNCDMAQGFYLHAPVAADEVDFGRIDFEAPSLSENPDFSSVPARTTGLYVRQ
jgi:EAL domain-containing protein (putative c-di-GMP-specific phosphodiesterase class I)/GGDEF domain-containing protein